MNEQFQALLGAINGKLKGSINALDENINSDFTLHENLDGKLDAKIGALDNQLDASLVILDRQMKSLGNNMALKLSQLDAHVKSIED